MQRLIVIGTLHAGLTPEHELLEVLERYEPDRLLVEITDADLKSDTTDAYPPEMIAAYRWAKQKGLAVRGFDSGIDTLRQGLTQKDNQRAIEEQRKALGKLTWKDLNKKENFKKLDIVEWLVDPLKVKERTGKMLANLRAMRSHEGIVVVVTGCGNLEATANEFPEA